jgi:hypothetical protein
MIANPSYEVLAADGHMIAAATALTTFSTEVHP